MTREQALTLLKEYNAEPFHLKHALTVEGVMKYFAALLGYGSERDFGALSGYYTTSISRNIRTSTVSRSRKFYAKPVRPKS